MPPLSLQMRLLAVLVILGALAAAAHASRTSDQSCSPAQLKGTLAEIPDSRERSTLHYTLLATNSSGGDCAMMGIPTGVLLGKTKNVLSTHVLKPSGSELYVMLKPGQAARSSVLIGRVAAKGESKKACEPLAYWYRLRGANGRGSIDIPLKPTARVCRFGRLDVTYWGPT